ncbi:MAG: CADD family putative folate metabolism protein [Acidobacteriota bacterium]
MNTASVLQRLDDLIQSRSILNHPFYQAWTAGTLTRADLATYASNYYPHVEAFPAYLETVIAGTSDAAIRAELLDNLREERSEPAPHPELWLRFAEGMGANSAAISSAETTSATRATVETFRALCAESTLAGLAALYAYESQQPEVAKRKAAGLCERYSVADPETLSYFTVHAEADLRHRQGERQAIASLLDQGASESELLASANRALDAYWGLLDGVCTEAGIHAC